MIHQDSSAWTLQVWVSFGLAVFLCGVGCHLPGTELDRAFMVMGYFFCLGRLCAGQVCARPEKARPRGCAGDTPLFKYVVLGAFFMAMALTGWGLTRMEINDTYRAFLGVSWLYLITSTFTLAKTLRDRYEADLEQAHSAGAFAWSATPSGVSNLAPTCHTFAGAALFLPPTGEP
ncbi:MAG: hypothetical protein IPN06_10180 [Burkholderiales bacterium]|nr:hypothetical protein [Burkholderiales bacterium]